MNNNTHRQDGRARKNKIQSLVIKHLREQGSLNILLPDGIVLEIGITQIGKDQKPVKCDGYCSVGVTKDDRTASLDSYNLGLSFQEKPSTIVFNDYTYTTSGESIRHVDVI